jgi:hypothetical protein
MYKDYSDFENEKQAKWYIEAVETVSKLVGKLRAKLETQQKVQ